MFVTNIEAKLLIQFNKANQIDPPIKLNEVVFVNPRASVSGDCNSIVDMQATPLNYRFNGIASIRFNRYSMQKALGGLTIPCEASDYGTIHELVSFLNTEYGLPLYTDEITDGIILPNATTVSIIPNAKSMYYTPFVNAILPFK